MINSKKWLIILSITALIIAVLLVLFSLNKKDKFKCPCHETSISKCSSSETKQKIDKLYKKLNNTRDLLERGETAQQISKLYASQGLYEQSLYYLYITKEEYILSLKDYAKGLSKLTEQQALRVKTELSNVLFEFGDIYKNMGNKKQALKYYKRAYKIRLSNKSTKYKDLLMSQYAIKDINIQQMSK